jgi:hypothetical protein
MPPGQFSYWNTDDAGREMLRSLMQSGHVDTLHSFGDLATTRAHAARALDELTAHTCTPQVWVDHATAPTNFGHDIMQGRGDVPGAGSYHADLTHAFGVRYVWRGRVTSVTGQDVRRSVRGIMHPQHPWGSLRTISKEVAKGLLGRAGSAKYAMHTENAVLRPIRLHSGHAVFEFLRSNPYWRSVDGAATADGLAEVLTPLMLRRLVRRQGTCLLYTHLGKISRAVDPFSQATKNALRALAHEVQEQRILVTTARRVLGYCRALREVAFAAMPEGEGVSIQVTTRPHTGGGPLPEQDLEGLTFYVDDPDRARIAVNGREVTAIRRHGLDQTGRRSISIPWTTLEFPHEW